VFFFKIRPPPPLSLQIQNPQHTILNLKYLPTFCLFEMMNEGLDALAALASTSPSAPTWDNSGLNNNNYSTQRINENPFSAHGMNGNTQASTSSRSAAAAPSGSHPVFSTSDLMQMLQNGSLSKLQQALQQCEAGRILQLCLATRPLMGMQRNHNLNLSLGETISPTQQQLSYYRCNMNGLETK
jgi:hypothetical protein